MATPNRRNTTRISLLLQVSYQMDEGLLDDYLDNLGEGGIRLRTDLPFEVGQQLRFSLSFPSLLEAIEARGVVRWRKEAAGEDALASLGVEFIFDPDQATKKQLNELVQQLKQSHDERLAPPPFRVLLVEDNEFMREMFDYAIRLFHAERCSERFIEVHCATTGPQALALLDAHSFDLAVIDHFLPELPGDEVVKRMRAKQATREIPALIVSAGGDEIRQRAMAAGADMYLDKPVMRKVLIDTIGTLTGIRAQREQ